MITLIRHAESLYNLYQKNNHPDTEQLINPGLTEMGIQQVKSLNLEFEELFKKFTKHSNQSEYF